MKPALRKMKFGAEALKGFEVKATELSQEGHWAVEPTHGAPRTLRSVPFASARGFRYQLQLLTTERGWVELMTVDPGQGISYTMADAIGLIYSIPDMARVEETQKEVAAHTNPCGFCERALAHTFCSEPRGSLRG